MMHDPRRLPIQVEASAARQARLSLGLVAASMQVAVFRMPAELQQTITRNHSIV